MSFQERGGYFYGFVDLTINEVFKYYPEFFKSLDILITCLDSSPHLPDLTKWMNYLKQTGWHYKMVGDKMWIPSVHVSDVFKQGKTFYHFDEAYLVRGIPGQETLPTRHYTTDGYDFSEEIPSDFIETFLRLGAVRYLSDGSGLNFVCESLEVAEKLEEVAAEVLGKESGSPGG